jgi:hypothetical protein
MTQQRRAALTSGQLGPMLQGLGKALPSKHFCGPFGLQKRQVSIHLPCLPQTVIRNRVDRVYTSLLPFLFMLSDALQYVEYNRNSNYYKEDHIVTFRFN